MQPVRLRLKLGALRFLLCCICRLLRARRERPRRHAAQQRDELAPFHCQWLPCFDRKVAHLGTAGDCCAAEFQPGSGADAAGEATRPCMSASPRKRPSAIKLLSAAIMPKSVISRTGRLLLKLATWIGPPAMWLPTFGSQSDRS